MPTVTNHSGLRNILRLDAVTCSAVAVLQLVLAQPLASLLGLDSMLLIGSAIFLLGYVCLLLATAHAMNIWTWLLQVIVIGNLGWGLGCLALTVGASGVTRLGQAYLALQAVVVFVIAAWQWRAGSQQVTSAAMPPKHA
ncbi:hypothetical protein G7047_14920 [Diaphorobacter sp. HDW4A]|uniref:hypothetical protein n=1 Tax=Diaphorobacter sp. HDW4A TaxID=2714924 RepID=UPI0014094009|nr:hypothetical protein [Diaphorobacter sp. HDW4A]QIL81045.1 hypothetical protein G7047_14920 [Diaphorobacter sp. HDW4A]